MKQRTRSKKQKGGNPIALAIGAAAAGPIIARGINWIIDKISNKSGSGFKTLKVGGAVRHKKVVLKI